VDLSHRVSVVVHRRELMNRHVPEDLRGDVGY
jgi:hypothetical protein